MDKKIILFLCLAGLSLILSCKVESPRKIQTPTTFPDQVVENTTMFFTVNGVRSAEIKIKHLEKYEKEDLSRGKGIYADIYDHEGKHVSTLQADSGWIKEKRQELMVMGNVVVKSDQGMILETQSLSWNPKTNKVTTEDFVKIIKGKDVITGYGLEADQELEQFRIKKAVKGKIKELPEEEGSG
jgi:LPS export ABC transporter protein LptC